MNRLWLWWEADWSVSAEACLILSKAVWRYFHICICKGSSVDASELLSAYDAHGWLCRADNLPHHHSPSVGFSTQQELSLRHMEMTMTLYWPSDGYRTQKGQKLQSDWLIFNSQKSVHLLELVNYSDEYVGHWCKETQTITRFSQESQSRVRKHSK